MTLGMLGVLSEIIHVKLLASAKHRVSTQYVNDHGDKGLPNTGAVLYLKEIMATTTTWPNLPP